MVADNAAQQAVVGGRHPVVVVDRYGGESRHIHTELLVFGNTLCKLRIQSVNTLNEQNVVRSEFQFIALIHTSPGGEVVSGHLDFLTGNKAVEVGIELLQVEGIERLIVIFAIGVLGSILSVHKVVVEGYLLGHEEVGEQLNAQTQCRGGLSARRRTGN